MGLSLAPFRLEPVHHERVWGGRRFSRGDAPVGELWLVWERNRVDGGPFDGRTLGDLADEFGEALIGRARHDTRFPLLIKLLDTREWLSVQVHPNDARAEALEGVGHVGKTEAWHVLDAEPHAQVIAGLSGSVDHDRLSRAMSDGSILDIVRYQPVQSGDTVYVPAGTIHALGPGLLVYEVQQSSDLTYRVFDWHRPMTAGRVLHIEQTLAVAEPAAEVSVLSLSAGGGATRDELVGAPYFTLERLSGEGTSIAIDTEGLSFHAVTVVEGTATIVVGDDRTQLDQFESLLIPAAVGPYRVQSGGRFAALLSRLP